MTKDVKPPRPGLDGTSSLKPRSMMLRVSATSRPHCGICGSKVEPLHKNNLGGICCEGCRKANNWPKNEPSPQASPDPRAAERAEFEVSPGSMVYENVLKCLELLKPLEVDGEPNTLLALVSKAMSVQGTRTDRLVGPQRWIPVSENGQTVGFTRGNKRVRGRPKKSGKRTMIRLDPDLALALPADKTDERNRLINSALRLSPEVRPYIDAAERCSPRDECGKISNRPRATSNTSRTVL